MDPIRTSHVVAIPYPGRSHINAMMNLCKQICAKKPDILVTLVVTEEWLGLIGPPGPNHEPDNLAFAAVPNVIPSEHSRAADLAGFMEAVSTKLQGPVEELLDRLEPKPSVVVADVMIKWTGSWRNVPVASFWPMSGTVFSMAHHFDLLRYNGHFRVDCAERGHEVVDYIPGVSNTRLADLPLVFHGNKNKLSKLALEAVSNVSKAQYLVFNSFYELESQVFDALKAETPFPLYTIGPSVPRFSPETRNTNKIHVPNYIQWLDSQPEGSVLYVSLGSFLSVSTAQLGEIVAGVTKSGMRFMCVSQSGALKVTPSGGNGLVVPWCDQLRVLCHPSVGGFLSHCGWNSTMEAVLGGVPVLAFPILADQIPNSKTIAEDLKIGLRATKESLVDRDEVAELVKRLMDFESGEGKMMRKNLKELQEACRQAVSKGGSSDTKLDAFIRDISKGK